MVEIWANDLRERIGNIKKSEVYKKFGKNHTTFKY